jgi:hypothetical protein
MSKPMLTISLKSLASLTLVKMIGYQASIPTAVFYSLLIQHSSL